MADAAHLGRPTPQPDGDPAGLSPELKLIREKFFRHIGKPVERKEDGRLLTGQVGRWRGDYVIRSAKNHRGDRNVFWVEHHEGERHG